MIRGQAERKRKARRGPEAKNQNQRRKPRPAEQEFFDLASSQQEHPQKSHQALVAAGAVATENDGFVLRNLRRSLKIWIQSVAVVGSWVRHTVHAPDLPGRPAKAKAVRRSTTSENKKRIFNIFWAGCGKSMDFHFLMSRRGRE